MAESERVQIRHPQTLEEREISREALPFFLNQDYEVLDSKGNVSASATTAAKKER